jgi:UDP-N-acetylglucosamine 4,6-dehydratase/5-epimerase
MDLPQFENKKLLITGGTGSFGKAFLYYILNSGFSEIRILSRDEKKQEDLRIVLNNDKVKFYLGDIRNYDSVQNAVDGVDYIFHAAALKQVPSCEFFPLEAIRTNVLGGQNVIKASRICKVKNVVILSTDKAVYPINAMGLSKAMLEKLMIAESRLHQESKTVFCATRYGNVMASRGSVIPLFLNQIKDKQPLTITNENMTRFLMTLNESVELVLFALINGTHGDIFIQKSPACTIGVLAKAMIDLTKSSSRIKVIGTRHGEKLYESLVSSEEMIKAIDMNQYYRIPMDGRNLNYSKYEEEGENVKDINTSYTSHNTNRLNIELVKKKLLELELINNFIK